MLEGPPPSVNSPTSTSRNQRPVPVAILQCSMRDNGPTLNGRPGTDHAYELQGPFRGAGPFQRLVMRHAVRLSPESPPRLILVSNVGFCRAHHANPAGLFPELPKTLP